MSDCLLFNFVVWGVIGGVLCMFGYVGNLLSVVALQREGRSATTTLLQSLAVSDLVLLVSVAVTDAIPYMCDYSGYCTSPWRGWPHVRYFWLLTPVAHMTSIWLVVLVAANRYWAVCRPHAAARVWTSRRTVGYVAMVVFCVIAFNFPRIFEYRIEAFTPPTAVVNSNSGNNSNDDNNNAFNASYVIGDVTRGPEVAYAAIGSTVLFPALATSTAAAQNETDGYSETDRTGADKVVHMREAITELGETSGYRVAYKVLFVNIVLVLLPLVTLIVLSVFVIKTLKRTPSYRLSLIHTKPLLRSEQPAAADDGPAAAVGGTRAAAAPAATGNGTASSPQSPAADDDERLPNIDEQLEPLNAKNHDERRATRSSNGRALRQSESSRGSRFGFTSSLLKGSIGRRNIDRKESTHSGGRSVNASREVTFVLVTVVLVAVVCQSPLAVFHFVRYAVSGYTCGHVIFYLEAAAKLLVNINSCVNFVIYCLLSPKFRGRLLDALTCKPQVPGRFGSRLSSRRPPTPGGGATTAGNHQQQPLEMAVVRN